MSNRYVILGLFCLGGIVSSAKPYVNLDDYTAEDCTYMQYQSNKQQNAVDRFLRDFGSMVVTDLSTDVVQTDAFWRAARQLIVADTINPNVSLEKAMQGLLATSMVASIKQVPVKYMSVDVDNNPIVLSGKIYLPSIGKPKGIVVANHYTIGSNEECPSRTFCLEAIFASKGYAVLMADYLGYGITQDSIHPYLHMKSVTRNVVDLIASAKNYLCITDQLPISNTLYLVGYSQGAAVTLGVQRLIEQEGIYSINRVFAGAGPYSPAATYDYCVRENNTGIPCAIPMLVQGMNVGERLGLTIQDFFQEPLLSNYDKWINSKNYTMVEINHLIGGKPLDKIMTAEGLDTTYLPTQRFYHALQRNEIIDWEPQSPIYLFHSTEDDMVPFLNSELLQTSFDEKGLENISYDFGEYGIHMQGALEFLQRVYNMLP